MYVFLMYSFCTLALDRAGASRPGQGPGSALECEVPALGIEMRSAGTRHCNVECWHSALECGVPALGMGTRSTRKALPEAMFYLCLLCLLLFLVLVILYFVMYLGQLGVFYLFVHVIDVSIEHKDMS